MAWSPQARAAAIAARKAHAHGPKRTIKRIGRTVHGVAAANVAYRKRRNRATAKATLRGYKNEMQFYKGAAIRTGTALTGAKAKSRHNQHIGSKGVAKRFVHGVKTNQKQYKKSVGYAKRVRKNQVRRAIRGH